MTSNSNEEEKKSDKEINQHSIDNKKEENTTPNSSNYFIEIWSQESSSVNTSGTTTLNEQDAPQYIATEYNPSQFMAFINFEIQELDVAQGIPKVNQT